MPHRNLIEAMYEIVKEGARARAHGTPNPYPADTVQNFLHVEGWLQEDLRLALIEAKPSYARSQLGRENWFGEPRSKDA